MAHDFSFFFFYYVYAVKGEASNRVCGVELQKMYCFCIDGSDGPFCYAQCAIFKITCLLYLDLPYQTYFYLNLT